MPAHFTMPAEFLELAAWSARMRYIDNGYGYLADPRGGRHCVVALGDPTRTGWSDYLRDPDRLWFVASTGGEGSSVCLWIDDEGRQHVVHHGSGSGSVLFAVLPSALAVLRLLAVGYEEPCWNTEWADPPSDDPAPLMPYGKWAFARWGVRPARTGIDALGATAVAHLWTRPDGPAGDPFAEWLTQPGTVVGS
jgi:hypothetical protein